MWLIEPFNPFTQKPLSVFNLTNYLTILEQINDNENHYFLKGCRKKILFVNHDILLVNHDI